MMPLVLDQEPFGLAKKRLVTNDELTTLDDRSEVDDARHTNVNAPIIPVEMKWGVVRKHIRACGGIPGRGWRNWKGFVDPPPEFGVRGNQVVR
jgi:hypothetical protein